MINFLKKILELLFPTILFCILWGIILLTNELSLLIIPFMILVYLVPMVYMFLKYKSKNYNIYFLPISFFIFYLFILVVDMFFEHGLVEFELSSVILILYCLPMFALTLTISIFITKNERKKL